MILIQNSTPDPSVAEDHVAHEDRDGEEAEGQTHDPRDFLALERTFLAYLRTSVALVSFGVVVTQLFVLKKAGPGTGAALGGASEVGGVVIVLVGCVRYFRQQKLLMQRKMAVAGWDLMVILAVLSGVLLAMLVVILVER